MKKGSVGKTFEVFDESIDNVEYVFVLRQAETGELWIPGVRRLLASALALLAASEWEWLVEALFVDLLNRDTSRYSDFTGYKIRRHVPRAECRALLSGLGYFDFRSTDELKRRAKQTLVPRHNAFQSIRGADGQKIDDLFRIRNYVAHQSRRAERGLREAYRRQGVVRFVSPGQFLSKDYRLSSVYLTAFWDAEESMRQFLGLTPRSKEGDWYWFSQDLEVKKASVLE